MIAHFSLYEYPHFSLYDWEVVIGTFTPTPPASKENADGC